MDNISIIIIYAFIISEHVSEFPRDFLGIYGFQILLFQILSVLDRLSRELY
jgi:hypothetical protein